MTGGLGPKGKQGAFAMSGFMRTTNGAIVGGVLAFCIGAFVLMFAVPAVRIAKLSSALSAAELLASGGRPTEALREITAIEPAARQFPWLTYRIEMQMVRCHVRTGDLLEARRHADLILSGCDSGGQLVPRPGAGSFVRNAPVWVIGSALNAGDSGSWDCWSGYEALMEELKASGETSQLALLADDLIQRFPGTPIANHAGLHTLATAAAHSGKSPTDAMTRTNASAPAAEPELVSDAPFQPPKPPHAEAPATNAPAQEAPAEPVPGNWGIVTNPVTYAYDTAGRPLREVPPGTLVDIVALRRVKDVDIAVCSMGYGERLITNVVFRIEDLNVRDGRLEDASSRERELRSRLAILVLEAGQLQAEQANQQANASPEVKAYEAAVAKYRDAARKADQLIKDMDRATGTRRIDIQEKLRKMKYEEPQLQQAMDAAKARLDASESQSLTAGQKQLAGVRKTIESIREELGEPQ